ADPLRAKFTGSIILHLLCTTGAAWPPLKLVNPFCAMKADDGPCKAIHKRYFFNIKNRKCEVFEYGGCHGNDNNFLTLEECQEKCAPAGQYLFSYPPTNSSFFCCCLGMHLNFFFTHPVHHLALFLGMPDFCYDPQEPGVCRGYFTRYFYNKETKSCEAFKYGGCLGNQNNFRTLEECQTVCRDNCKLMFLITLSFYSCIKKCVNIVRVKKFSCRFWL
uniref:Tissue factor pathway inhibitor n=1 Tax=Catharus ustulatus TaxID=91951 RepID=A0A8C3V8R7_CATUS